MSEPTSETGALSVDQAVASLLAPEPAPTPETDAPEAPVEAAEEQEEIAAGDQPAEEAEDGAETPPTDEEEPEAEAVAPLDPPAYWSKEAKARFADLAPELQAVVLSQEGPREEAAAKAKADAAEKIKAADAEVGKVAQLAEALAERVPQWIATFETRWGSQAPDWVAYAQEHGVEAMTLLKTQFEQERSRLAEALQARDAAETQARQAFVKAEFAKLAEIEPELADPETGPAIRTEITQFLVKRGVEPAAIQNISAVEMSIARDAMLYRKAQAALAAPKPPKPVAAIAQKAAVRPAAAQAQSSSQRSHLSRQNAFNAKPSVDNAIALLLAAKGP